MIPRPVLIVLLALAAVGLGALAGYLHPLEVRPPTAGEADERPAVLQLPDWYEYPPATYPGGESAWEQAIAAGALFLALGAAAYLALKQRSRRGLFVLMLGSLLYFGFIRKGCVCPVGSIQHVASAVLAGGPISFVVALFFILPLAFALLFGRVFCAAVCPLGAVQDLVLVRPTQVPHWLEHALGLLPYVCLGLAVLFAATGGGHVVCRYDPFVAFFRLSGSFQLLVMGFCVLVICLFVGRAYCRFVCPYGVLLRFMSHLSKWHVTITPDECVQCRLCEDACPFNAIQKPTDPAAATDRRTGKLRLGLLLLALPLLVGLGGWLGGRASGWLVRAHPALARAERARQDALEGTVKGEKAKQPGELYAREAAAVRAFDAGAPLLGGWIGLVVGLRLLGLSVRRRRTDYGVHRGSCVSCGRCFRYCPREHRRLRVLRGEIEEPPRDGA